MSRWICLFCQSRRLWNNFKLGHYQSIRPVDAFVAFPVGHGRSCRADGEHLSITVETVRWHLKQIYQKLHVHGCTEAALEFMDMQQKHPA